MLTSTQFNNLPKLSALISEALPRPIETATRPSPPNGVTEAETYFYVFLVYEKGTLVKQNAQSNLIQPKTSVKK